MKKIVFFTVGMVFLFINNGMAARLAVVADKANIRSGPGTNHAVLWSVGKYYPVDTIKKSGNWYKIKDFEDDQGWVYHTLVKKIPAVIVKVPLANVREGASTQTRVLFQAEKGVSFKRLSVKGKWIKVQHADGEIGWLHQSLIWGY